MMATLIHVSEVPFRKERQPSQESQAFDLITALGTAGQEKKSGQQEAADRSSECPGMAPGTPKRRGYPDPVAQITSAPDLTGGQSEPRTPQQL